MSRPSVRGLLDVEQLRYLVEREEIETVITAFPDIYGRLMGKRVTGRFFLHHILPAGMHACDYLLTCDMEMDPVQGYRFSSWETGYGDFRLVPDLATLRVASWLDKTALVLCDVYDEKTGAMVPIAPRTILKRQMERARAAGFTPKGGSELEFFLFTDSYEEAARKRYVGLNPYGYYIEDYHIFQGTKEEKIIGAIRYHLERSGIPVEFSKGEWGPGQHEINLEYADFLEMADRHVIYKHAAKEIAWQMGVSLTFMAKWDERYAGSSMHLHASLWDASGTRPLFPAEGEASFHGVAGSEVFRRFLAGWMAHAREITAFYAPYPTSYKRYQAGSFAPTRIAWSIDNRTVAFRVVGHGPSLRIECRAPGADANPYLAFAATLAAGLDGIERGLEPPPPFTGNAYAAEQLPRLPSSLPEAVEELTRSEWTRRTFGPDVIEHYAHFFRTEQAKFDAVVTDWERARYFERA